MSKRVCERVGGGLTYRQRFEQPVRIVTHVCAIVGNGTQRACRVDTVDGQRRTVDIGVITKHCHRGGSSIFTHHCHIIIGYRWIINSRHADRHRGRGSVCSVGDFIGECVDTVGVGIRSVGECAIAVQGYAAKGRCKWNAYV